MKRNLLFKGLLRSTLVTVVPSVLSLFIFTTASAAAPDSFQQCDDGRPPTGTCNWVNGILNSTQTTYMEGMATPQRILYRGQSFANGTSHTLQFSMQWTKGGKHAYDWPVSWSVAETLAQSVGGFSLSLSPVCLGLSGPNETACNSVPVTSTLSVPDDTYVSGQFAAPAANGNTFSKIAAFEGAYGNDTITFATDVAATVTMAAPVHSVGNGLDSGDSDVTYTINFTPTGGTLNNILLLFAAHIAISDNPGDPAAPGVTWGLGSGASNISGAPYHVKNICIDGVGCSGGGNDNQLDLSGGSVFPSLVTAISNTARTFGLSVTDQLSVSASKTLSGTAQFYICGPTGSPQQCLPPGGTLVSSHPISDAVSPFSQIVTSAVFTPTANGNWCFRAVWLHGDINTQSTEVFTTTGGPPTNSECVTISSPTAVALSSMKAWRNDSGPVTLVWNTGSEVNTAGFNIYRSESPKGPYTRINAQLIPASTDSLSGAKYAYEDVAAVAGRTYYYQLEDVELNGASTRHDPILVTTPSGPDAPSIPLAGFWIGAGVLLMGVGLLIVRARMRQGLER